MKVKSLSFNRSSGRDGAVKTAIKLKQHPTLCPLTRQNRPLFEVPLRQKRRHVLRMRRGRTTLTSKPRGLMPLKLPASLQKETSYEGFAVSVTDEQGNEVAYVPIGEAAN